MLRSVLRNVQYYLLFFTIPLVLLAFNRLKLLDHHQYAFLDRPGGIITPTSPDNAGRIYYGGDESREIGLVKFRLGLFKFVLPTFSDEDSWENNEISSSSASHFLRVPPPPNNKNKLRRGISFRLQQMPGQQSREEVQVDEEFVVKVKGNTTSVAYVIIIPSISKSFDSSDMLSNNIQSYLQKVNALSQSIAKAHTNSTYEFQLYALNLDGASVANSKETEEDDVRKDGMKRVHEKLLGAGFLIINDINISDNNRIQNKEVAISASRMLKGGSNNTPHLAGLLQILKGHNVVVQLSHNFLISRPLDNLFDTLLMKAETAQVDSYILQALGEDELFMFRTSSREASRSYLQMLICQSGAQQVEPKLVASNFPTFWPHKRPRIASVMAARKNQELGSSHSASHGDANECRFRPTTSTQQLDKCLYIAGTVEATSRDCARGIVNQPKKDYSQK